MRPTAGTWPAIRPSRAQTAFFVSASIMGVLLRVHDLSPHGVCTKPAATHVAEHGGVLLKVPVWLLNGRDSNAERGGVTAEWKQVQSRGRVSTMSGAVPARPMAA